MQLLLAAVLWQLSGAYVNASEVFRWVDADGVVHYSDTKPENEATLTTLELNESVSADYDPFDDPYSIQNQARRLNDTWKTLAQARAEREKRIAATTSEPIANAYIRNEPNNEYRSIPYFMAPVPSRYPVFLGTARRQFRAIEDLMPAGPRPHSINSGGHRERVQRSQSLPVAPIRREAR